MYDHFIEDVIIIGSGSAGRRHALALRELFPNASINVIKRSNSQQPTELLTQKNINIVDRFENIEGASYGVVVIASPATLHCDDALRMIENSNFLLIEKPVTADLKSAMRIQSILKNSKKKLRVAYHLRFSETVVKVKELIESGTYGKLASANFNYSQSLPLWRPLIDERQSVSARKELGGGVLLELSHEIEAVQYLMGDINSVSNVSLSKEGANTDGEVETLATFSGETKNGKNFNIHLDMITSPPIREWSFKFESAQVEANLLAGVIQISDNGADFYKIHESEPLERDRAELSLLKSFLDIPNFNKIDLCTIDEATNVIKVIDAVKGTHE
jgi:predicted dehydrogenase